jgi:hypothetical protein
MKKSLVAPNQPCMSYDDPPVELGYTVVEVADNEFPVSSPLFWNDCPDDIVAYRFYWSDGSFYPVPSPPPMPPLTDPSDGPVVL